jgi:hypothetical protein
MRRKDKKEKRKKKKAITLGYSIYSKGKRETRATPPIVHFF